MDFYAYVAAALTLMLATALLVKGFGPRSAITLTGASFMFAMLWWAVARSIAFYTQREESREHQ